MSTENYKSRQYPLRKRSQYNESPSVVLRVVDYTPDDEEVPTLYSNKFINPFLPIAMLTYNIPNEPMAGVTGLDIDVVDEMTEAAPGPTFGIDMVTLLNNNPTLIMLYSILKDSPSDLEYIYLLASRLPEECWILPVNITVNNPAYVADIFNNKRRLLILEKR